MNFESEDNKIESEKKIDSYIKSIFSKKYVSLEDLQEAKEAGFPLENLLNEFCAKNELLMHGSISKINDAKLKSESQKIFASDNAAIAIMRSMYSNNNVNLEYDYRLDRNPLELIIHKSNHEPIIVENGYLYLISKDDFTNEPEGSWQYVNKSSEVDIEFIVETEKDDFKYPVKIIEDNKR